MTLSIHSPDELVAVIPHMLGFKPEESIVFVPMRSDLLIARVDHPMTPRDQTLVWRSISDGLTRDAQTGAAVGIVCFTSDRQHADAVGHDCAEQLDAIGIDTHVLLWADDTRWADLATGDMGLQTDAARERIAARAGWGRPLRTVIETAIRDLRGGEREQADARRPLGARSHGAVPPRRRPPHDKDAAMLLVAIETIPTRDRLQLWLDINRGSVASHVALWTDMTRRAPDDVRAAPASLLAFGSW